MSTVCKGIEKVRGGFIVTLPFPWGSHQDGGQVVVQTFAVVVQTFAEVVELLRKAANEEVNPDGR